VPHVAQDLNRLRARLGSERRTVTGRGKVWGGWKWLESLEIWKPSGNLGSPNVSQSGSSAPGEVALATFDQSHAHLPQVLRYFQHLSAVVGCVMLKYVEIM